MSALYPNWCYNEVYYKGTTLYCSLFYISKEAVKFNSIFLKLVLSRPPDKSAYWKILFYFSCKTYVVGTQKNRLNETFL